MCSFRVTLFLHHFFSDQRASCRIYITSQMTSIQHLQNHIIETFHLDKDFYLISNNLYLPSTEDVRILKEDDIIIATPCNSTQLQICNNRRELEKVAEPLNTSKDYTIKRRRNNSDVDDNFKKKKKYKKYEAKDSECIDTETVAVEDTYNCSKKKKKKNKEKTNKDLSDNENCTNDFKKEGNDKQEKMEVNYFTDTVKAESMKKKFKEKNDNASKTTPSSTLVKLSTKCKKIELMKISTKPKIIKTIHVYDHKPTVTNKILDELPKSEESEDEANSLVNCKSTDTISKIVDNKTSIENPESKICNEEINVKNDFLTSFNVNNSIISVPKENVEISVNNDKTNENTKYDEIVDTNNYSIDPITPLNNSVIPTVNCDLNTVDNNCDLNAVDNKEIILSNGPKDLKINQIENDVTKIILSTENNKDQNHSTEISENKKVVILDNVCLHSSVCNKDSSISSVISTEEYSESIASTADETSFELLKPKRKRKRIRKKKVKQQPVEDTTFATPFPISTKPDNMSSSFNKHIRFENNKDDCNEIAKEIEAQSDQSNADSATNNDIQNNQQDQNILSPFNYEKLCNEEIMKYPVMVHKYPKTGDILAFKIYILSPNYTPEISNFIIGKVINYDTENKMVFLRILVGNEQCADPIGKFYIETEIPQMKPNERYIAWEALKEPRLLFP